MKKWIQRNVIKKANWKNFRSVTPLSTVFGLDRGKPIDRVYIEDFLERNKQIIQGVVCEISEDTYTKQFGTNIVNNYIFSYEATGQDHEIVGDLSKPDTVPHNNYDTFIVTQTLNFVYDFHSAVQSIYCMLKPNGTALVTLAGLCQISEYDMNRWGDYWRFTSASVKKMFSEKFGEDYVTVTTYGNVLTAVSLLEGLSAQELRHDELMHNDDRYQVIIAIKATKKV